MYFEGRELPLYAVPVSEHDLKIGSVYFSITFVDDEMLIPEMHTIVFAGRDLDGEHHGLFYFQDVDSYREGIRFVPAAQNQAQFFKCLESELCNIFQFEHALDLLMLCSLKRRKIDNESP